MSVRVAPAALRMLAAVHFAVVSQTSVAASAFVAPAALTGFLTWGDQQPGPVLNLSLPVRSSWQIW